MKPTVFLSFANHQDNHLSMLEREVEQIENALQSYHDKGYLEIYKTENLNTSILSKQGSRFANRIIIFHYGGHANSQKLALKDGVGNSSGIAQLITANPKKAPKLVFLNGCSTKEQVQYFFNHGVQAVIATSVPISDFKAVEFSNVFYERLANNFTLEQSFQKATAHLETKYGGYEAAKVIQYRGFVTEEIKATLPWGLYYNDEKILQWKLPKINKIRLFIIALLAVILLGLSGFGIYKNQLNSQPFNFKVNVHGKAGNHDLILKEQGKVVLRLPEGYKPLKENIDENGQAFFQNIDAELLDKAVEVYIEHNQPYQSLVPDSLYSLQRNGNIELTVQLNNLHQLTGKILDFKTEQPLDSVRISIHPKVFTYTNEFGEFILEIPETYQQKFQQVTVFKKGYDTDTFNKVPIHTQDRFEYALKPLK